MEGGKFFFNTVKEGDNLTFATDDENERTLWVQAVYRATGQTHKPVPPVIQTNKISNTQISRMQGGKKITFYHKNPEISDTQKFAVITLKVEQDGISLRVMHPKDAEGIANSVDPDQTAPLGAVWSGSALFAQTCLSENLETLR